MRTRNAPARLVVVGAAAGCVSLGLVATPGAGQPAKPSAADVAKQWVPRPLDLAANGKVTTQSPSSGDRLRWFQFTLTLKDVSAAEAFARTVRFYAGKCGSDYDHAAKRVIGHRGETADGRRFIVGDVNLDPREVWFACDGPAVTASGLIRPAAPPAQVEVILTVAVR